MKKYLKWIILALVLSGIGSVAIYVYMIPEDNLNSIYLVPKDAIYVIETDAPIDNWKTISRQGWWSHLRSNDYFAELTESANGLDSMVQSNEWLFDAVGSRKLIVSAHMYKRNDYDFLYIVDLKKVSKFSGVQSFLKKLVESDNFRVTERAYHNITITEMFDKVTKETLYLAFVKNNLLASYRHTLIEQSIDQYMEPIIGRDLNYIEVSRKVDGENMARIYMQYDLLDDYMKCYMDESNEYLDDMSKSLLYSGLSLDISDEGLIKMSGYTNLNDTTNSYLMAMAKSGSAEINSYKIASKRTATLMGLGFDSFDSFYDNLDNLMQEDKESYDEYQKNIRLLERFLGISIKDNFFSWIGDELAIINSEPVHASKENEFALIFKANDIDDAKENLALISRQVRRRTPTRFNEVTYRGYTINYLSVKGLFKMILGKMFGKLEKPYFTFIDDYVIFSNHPQTLKNMIDDYMAGNTMDKSEEFTKFYDEFSGKSNAFFYMNMPILHNNLGEFMDAETKKSMDKNKPYIVCFSQIGFQLSKDGDLFETNLITQYRDPNEAQKELEEVFEISEDASKAGPEVDLTEASEVGGEEPIEVSEILLDDLSAKKQTDNYENGQIKAEVGIKDGLKHGSYYEYYENGEIKIKGKYKMDEQVGTWKEYDSTGVVIKKMKY